MTTFQIALVTFSIIGSLYYIPYLVKRGWDSGALDVNPKKKKVCDICFRDLKKVKELFEKENENN